LLGFSRAQKNVLELFLPGNVNTHMNRNQTAFITLATLVALAVSCGPLDNPTPQAPQEPVGNSVVSPPPGSSDDAGFAAHVKTVESRAPEGFTVVPEPPFVVIGDEASAQVRSRASGTVRWTVKMLRQDFFKKDPSEIIDIWLFKDDTSYRHHAKTLFGDKPDTPYGYYSAADRALVMNISTGGGTLVHELVHPFIRANFPECPAWFNEGLGSLYEQSANRDGHIVGLTNWRLAGLKQAIAGGEVPSFEILTSTTEVQFYDQDPGTNYGQARYLCLYLQEKGLLVPYYHEFVANHDSDTTGYKTLMRVLGVKDMAQFKKEWESWVMGLSFP
jgi:hypothetical protein